MRGAGLAGVGLVLTLIAGCGSAAPTRAQIEAQERWFTVNQAAFGTAAQPTLQFASQTSGAHIAYDCHELAASATAGLSTRPMPVASLEGLWKSYLDDLAGAARSCSKGVNETSVDRQVSVAITQLVRLADSLPSVLHRHPRFEIANQ